MKPKLKYSTRPKKTGARKRYRILTHKKRLVAAGYEMNALNKLTVVEIRDLLKKAAMKKGSSPKRKAPKATAKAKE